MWAPGGGVLFSEALADRTLMFHNSAVGDFALNCLGGKKNKQMNKKKKVVRKLTADCLWKTKSRCCHARRDDSSSFGSKVSQPPHCWDWMRALGRTSTLQRVQPAHRLPAASVCVLPYSTY